MRRRAKCKPCFITRSPKRKGVRIDMKIRKLIATLSLSAMMLNLVATSALATSGSAMTFEVTGNGVETDNDIVVHVEQDTDVNQSNEFNATTNVNANSNTGGNSASRNTGGNAVVDTGDATSHVEVSNAGNSNEAVVDCCAATQGADVLISGNGDSSDNFVKLHNENEVDVDQENESRIVNTINNDATTGWNRASRNTGGDVEVTTGEASAITMVYNAGNINSAVVSGAGHAGGVSARILGNGVDSDNDIWLSLDHEVELDQENSARIDNFVDTDAVSGKNHANRNTGGDVLVDTGDAYAGVLVDNAVNFNYADVDCGCLFDVTAKIAENGDSSDNKIKASLENELEVDQENSCADHHRFPIRTLFGKESSRFPFFGGKDCLENDIYADAFSGWNNADRNTGESGSDPAVYTGDAETEVVVENAGSSNVFGDVSDWDLPGEDDHTGNNVSVNVSFDLASLLSLLGLLS